MGQAVWTDDTGPIKDVRKGMPVVDLAGQTVGRVEFVKLGDPEAVTTQGQRASSDGILHVLRRFIGWREPDTAAQLADHLTRIGFVKVDGKWLLERDTYVAADQIVSVANGSVHLSVKPDDLRDEI
jgi:hypothetical protein